MPQYIKVFPNALPKDLCRQLIEAFEKDKRVRPDPQPDYSRRTYLNISLLPEWSKLLTRVLIHANKITEEYFAPPEGQELVGPEEWLDDGYILAKYSVGDVCALHYDGQHPVEPNNGLRLATQLFYLNDVAEGGETFFPRQNVKVKPEQGKAIMFPPEWTHAHEVLPAREPRYILQTWITDPLMVVNLADGG